MNVRDVGNNKTVFLLCYAEKIREGFPPKKDLYDICH